MEKRILLFSTILAVAFAFFGLFGGFLANSDMILFDGIYSLISAGLSVFSIFALGQMNIPDEDKYPFGKAHFEPMIVILKSLIIIGMCLFSTANAVLNLMNGGNEMNLGIGLYYSMFSVIGCSFMSFVILSKNKIIKSQILKAEFNQWIGDTLLSAGVLLGFLLCYGLNLMGVNKFNHYIDSIMVICSSVIFISMPMKSLMRSIREIFFVKADNIIIEQLKAVIDEFNGELKAKYKLRAVQIGRELSVEVNFLTDKDVTIVQVDNFRKKIANIITGLNKSHWINVNFTSNEDWL